jgi:hypothetical protein
MTDNSSGGFFGDGSCFFRPREPVESSFAEVDAELGGALSVLRDKTAASAKAAEQARTLDEIRALLADQLQEILAPQIDAKLDKWETKPTTRSKYKRDFQRFKLWCETIGVPCLPAAPEVVALYFVELAEQGLAVPTLKRMRSSIARVHELASYSPTRHLLVSAAISFAAKKAVAEVNDTEH